MHNSRRVMATIALRALGNGSSMFVACASDVEICVGDSGIQTDRLLRNPSRTSIRIATFDRLASRYGHISSCLCLYRPYYSLKIERYIRKMMGRQKVLGVLLPLTRVALHWHHAEGTCVASVRATPASRWPRCWAGYARAAGLRRGVFEPRLAAGSAGRNTHSPAQCRQAIITALLRVTNSAP